MKWCRASQGRTWEITSGGKMYNFSFSIRKQKSASHNCKLHSCTHVLFFSLLSLFFCFYSDFWGRNVPSASPSVNPPLASHHTNQSQEASGWCILYLKYFQFQNCRILILLIDNLHKCMRFIFRRVYSLKPQSTSLTRIRLH